MSREEHWIKEEIISTFSKKLLKLQKKNPINAIYNLVQVSALMSQTALRYCFILNNEMKP